MNSIFYFLGFIAQIAERLRRISINGISLLLALVFLSLLFSIIFLTGKNESFQSTASGYILLFVGAIFLFSWIRGHKFFQSSEFTEKNVSQDLNNLLCTGKFDLDNTHTKKFFLTPGILSKNEKNELIFYANVDASDSFFGLSSGNKKGIWTLEILNLNSQTISGYFYWGFKRYPTLKITYRLPNNPISTTVFLSSRSESQINKLRSETSDYFNS